MIPFLAALGQAGGIIIDKIILTRRRVELRIFIPILFVFLFALTILLLPWFGWFSADLWTLKYQIIFWTMIATAISWNFLYYFGIRAEKVQEFELIIMSQPLITVLLASIFLAGERNWPQVLAAVIASVALLLSRIQKQRLEFSREMWALVLAIILMSVELILIDLLLEVLSPVALYAVRTGIMTLFFYFFYRPRYQQVSLRNYGLILITASLGVLQMVAKFYGFAEFGVIYTSLILILAPVLVYLISTVWLHERLKARTVVAALIILACIVYAMIMGK